MDRVGRSLRKMREEVVKARLINREDADLLKLNFPKMRWAACSINGRAPAYLADEVRAIRNRWLFCSFDGLGSTSL